MFIEIFEFGTTFCGWKLPSLVGKQHFWVNQLNPEITKTISDKYQKKTKRGTLRWLFFLKNFQNIPKWLHLSSLWDLYVLYGCACSMHDLHSIYGVCTVQIYKVIYLFRISTTNLVILDCFERWLFFGHHPRRVTITHLSEAPNPRLGPLTVQWNLSFSHTFSGGGGAP